eukprot:jgi/Bigna1/69398/fgenesh1_pg.8_\
MSNYFSHIVHAFNDDTTYDDTCLTISKQLTLYLFSNFYSSYQILEGTLTFALADCSLRETILLEVKTHLVRTLNILDSDSLTLLASCGSVILEFRVRQLAGDALSIRNNLMNNPTAYIGASVVSTYGNPSVIATVASVDSSGGSSPSTATQESEKGDEAFPWYGIVVVTVVCVLIVGTFCYLGIKRHLELEAVSRTASTANSPKKSSGAAAAKYYMRDYDNDDDNDEYHPTGYYQQHTQKKAATFLTPKKNNNSIRLSVIAHDDTEMIRGEVQGEAKNMLQQQQRKGYIAENEVYYVRNDEDAQFHQSNPMLVTSTTTSLTKLNCNGGGGGSSNSSRISTSSNTRPINYKIKARRSPHSHRNNNNNNHFSSAAANPNTAVEMASSSLPNIVGVDNDHKSDESEELRNIDDDAYLRNSHGIALDDHHEAIEKVKQEFHAAMRESVSGLEQKLRKQHAAVLRVVRKEIMADARSGGGGGKGGQTPTRSRGLVSVQRHVVNEDVNDRTERKLKL